MPKIEYVFKKFKGSSLELIEHANEIIEDYAEQGFTLTLRQLYYQFVSRVLITNTMQSYKRLGSVVNDARLAGYIDWNAIVDRTRNMVENPHWKDPSKIIESAAGSYRLDTWEGQHYQPEVWIEKEALAGIIEGPCRDLDIPFFACRGYTSQSEMWSAAQRLMRYETENGRAPVIIHLGDHDPSGIDMTRDIEERLAMFFNGHGMVNPVVERISLNMDQIRHFNPPPNPAKTTDSRYADYRNKFGEDSWELDALDPKVIVELVNNAVAIYEVKEIRRAVIRDQEEGRQSLELVAEHWSDVVDYCDDHLKEDEDDD